MAASRKPKKATQRKTTRKPLAPTHHSGGRSPAEATDAKPPVVAGDTNRHATPAGRGGGVTIRMYRQGLGDCFLITFPANDGSNVHMLIDCGVILGTSDPKTIMGKVVRSIKEATGGVGAKRGHIHYLLATHEHWDHLSGFIQAQDVFDEIDIDNIWLAWTEDPTNQFANSLRAQRNKSVQALRAIATKMQGMNGLEETGSWIQSLVEFFGPDPNDPRAMAAAGGGTTKAALDYLKGRKDAKVAFRNPGEPRISLPGVSGVRIYVLGPPENEMIKKSNPTAAKEVYELSGMALSADAAFFAAAGEALGLDSAGDDSDPLPTDDANLRELSYPFDKRYRLPTVEAKDVPFFKSHYFGPADSPTQKNQSWRRIEQDWLGSASELALNLDSNTNNTSLAIAIELLPSGKVLLFPADAQVGNWMSWSASSWPGDKPNDPPTKSDDLLKRTVFYKVGHHGSHNATMRAEGLELMESPDLVAFIPVNHEMAVKKRWGAMPFIPLLTRLVEKTRGRVVRIDEGLDKAPPGVADAQWNAFTAQVGADPSPDKLYVEWVIET